MNTQLTINYIILRLYLNNKAMKLNNTLWITNTPGNNFPFDGNIDSN